MMVGLNALPQRLVIPLMFLLLGSAMLTYTVAERLINANQQIESERQQYTLQLLQQIQSLTGESLQNNNLHDVQQVVSLTSALKGIKDVVILDDRLQIIAASRFAWLDQPINVTGQGLQPALREQFRQSNTFTTLISEDGQNLEGYAPLQLAPTPGQLRSERQGLLRIRVDLESSKTAFRQRAAQQAFIDWLVLAGVSILVWLWLVRSQKRRLGQLLSGTRRIAEGRFDQPIRLEGRDELTQIGKAINQMMARLSTQQQDLLDSMTRYRALFESNLDGIALYDLDGNHIDANPAYLRLCQRGLDDLKGLHYSEVTPEKHRLEETLRLELLQYGHTRDHEREFIGKDGKRIPVSVKMMLLLDQNQRPRGMWSLVRDISEKVRTRDMLRLSATVFDASNEAILITDLKGTILSANPACCRLSNQSLQELEGKPLPMLAHPDDNDPVRAEIQSALHAGGNWQGEYWMKRVDGGLYPVWLSASSARNDKGQPEHFIVLFADISERKAAEAQTRYLAEHDSLTGLPNRTLFLDRLNQALRLAEREKEQIALMFLDLDHFKNINDSLGHSIGDQLLTQAANRIRSELRRSDTVSRQGGDEFLILLPAVGSPAHAGSLAEKLLESVCQPFFIEGLELTITLSIGISLYPDDGNDPDTLIKNADAAMYLAKEKGRNNYQFYINQLNEQMVARMAMESHLRRALQNNELRLHYQPQVSLNNHRIHGVEALLRWQNPELGFVPPDRFIPVAEDCGLINSIGAWVLREACEQNLRWQAMGLAPITMAVNVSAIQFRQEGFIELVQGILRDTGLPPEQLELEMTESVMMEGGENVLRKMQALRALGISLSLDDFGTGYSSLSYLKQFPIQQLKIDKSFVQDVNSDPYDTAIVQTILLMCESLGLDVVAEGVETAAQLEFLSLRNCTYAQGYYFSRPVPGNDLIPLLQNGVAQPAAS